MNKKKIDFAKQLTRYKLTQ